MRATLAVLTLFLSITHATHADAAPRAVTVFLEREGRIVERDGEEVIIPAFGGGDRAWSKIVACVTRQFSPFRVEVVDRRPGRGDFITAVIGGRASQLGLDDDSTNGVGPYNGRVIRNAYVYIFSQVGSGERDVANLCAVTVHEVSHSLGLDHTYKCGDVMSYFLDRCGPRRILDVEAPCGETRARRGANGQRTQNSYRQLAARVGLRDEPDPWEDADAGELDEEPAEPPEAWDNEAAYPEDEARPRQRCGGRR